MRRNPLAATAVALLVGLWVDGAPARGSAVSLALVLLAAVTLSTVAHEAGHCLAAKLVGLKVARVTIGRGKPLMTMNVLGVPVVVGRVPGGGRTLVRSAAVMSRPRMSLFALGGVLSNLLIGAASTALAVTVDLWPLYVLAFANGCGLLNLMPFRYGEDAMASDGLYLLHIWRRRTALTTSTPSAPQERSPGMLGLGRDPWVDQPGSEHTWHCCVCGFHRVCQAMPGPWNAAPGKSFPICGSSYLRWV